MGVTWFPCANYKVCDVTRLADCNGGETHWTCSQCYDSYCSYCSQTLMVQRNMEWFCLYCTGEEVREEDLLEYALQRLPNLEKEYRAEAILLEAKIPREHFSKVVIIDIETSEKVSLDGRFYRGPNV